MIPRAYKARGKVTKFMTKEIKLAAQKRAKSEKVAALRKSGLIPACMYGPNFKPEDLKVKKSDFDKVFAVAGESHLLDLSTGAGAPVKVIIKDSQRHTLSGNVIHVDFYKVDMGKKITTEIPLRFTGESKAVKELGGILVKAIESVKVKCLAKDLADFIEVDLSVLALIHDAVRLHNLKLPTGMELVSHTDEIVATVIEHKVEVEKPAEAAVPAEGEVKAEAGAEAKTEGKTEGKTEAKTEAPAKK